MPCRPSTSACVSSASVSNVHNLSGLGDMEPGRLSAMARGEKALICIVKGVTDGLPSVMDRIRSGTWPCLSDM